MNWKDFLAFRRMVTPIIIQVIFWIGVVGVILSGIVLFFSMLVRGIGQGEVMPVVGALIGVPLMTIVGLLLVRLYTELLIVIFRINDTLTDIKNLLEARREA